MKQIQEAESAKVHTVRHTVYYQLNQTQKFSQDHPVMLVN